MSALADFRVLPATEADIPTILRLVRALAEYERMHGAVTANEQQLRNTLFGPDKVADAAIGYAGDEPAGAVVYFRTYSTFLGRPGLYLEDIIVDERWRGQGLGKVLMRYVAQRAIEQGCARFEWAVLDWNAPAIGFYESLGAKAQDQWTVYRLAGDALTQLAADTA